MPTALKNHRPVRTRSPFFINCVPTTGETIESATLTVKIKNGSRSSSGTTLKTYTLSKSNAVDGIIVFDIAPLASDFLDHSYNNDIKFGQVELADNSNISANASPVSEQGRYLTLTTNTSNFCNLKVGDKWFITTPAFAGGGGSCTSSYIEKTWEVTLLYWTATDIVFDYGEGNETFYCLSLSSAALDFGAKAYKDNSAAANEVLFVEIDKTVVDSGGPTETLDIYHTANFGYSGFKDGVNFLPTTGAIGNYGYVAWSPTVAKETDVTIMATNCYRQMGQDSYAILPIFTGEFDRNNPNVSTRGRIKFGPGQVGPSPSYDTVEKWLWFSPDSTSAVTVNNITDIEIIPSDGMTDQVEYSVTYLPLGKKNLCSNFVTGEDYLRVGHFVDRVDLGSPYVSDENDLASVNGQDVLRYEIVCEPKYNVVDCLFVNKFGFWDSFSFIKKSMSQMVTTESKFQRNIGEVVNSEYTYSVNAAQKQKYNVNGSKSIIVNTGFVNESFSQLLEEILLSESIVLIIDDVFTQVTIQTNQVDLKKSVNDNLINYSLTFDFAYNELNNVV